MPDDDGDEPTLVVGWRYERLLAAGYDCAQACELAMRTDVDLHRACDLASLCGPDTALRILA